MKKEITRPAADAAKKVPPKTAAHSAGEENTAPCTATAAQEHDKAGATSTATTHAVPQGTACMQADMPKTANTAPKTTDADTAFATEECLKTNTAAASTVGQVPAATPQGGAEAPVFAQAVSVQLNEVATPLYQAAKPAVTLPPFVAEKADTLFALLYFVLGECYWRVLLHGSNAETWTGAAGFAAVYAVCVLGYVFAKRRSVPKTSWFWLAVLLAEGLGSALWPNEALTGYAGVFLHATAIYWTLQVTGALVAQRTSCFLPADLLNGFVVLPFANFFARIRCLWLALRRGVPRKSMRQVLLGVALLAMVLCLVLPRLAAADEAFNNAFDNFMQWLSRLTNGGVLREIQYFLFALPVAAYLFGLAYGAINRRHTQHLAQPRLQAALAKVHLVPGVSVQILLGGVCALYVLFIALQAQQLFAAFYGQLSGTQIYSRYAREGFFSLCQVAVINGAVLLFVQVFSKNITRVIKTLQTVLCVLTLLILASAARKLALYIEAYDLTPSRLLAMVFMLWLAVTFVALVVRLYVPFPFVRTVVCVGAVLVAVLFLCNVDMCIERFNAAHVSIYELHAMA